MKLAPLKAFCALLLLNTSISSIEEQGYGSFSMNKALSRPTELQDCGDDYEDDYEVYEEIEVDDVIEVSGQQLDLYHADELYEPFPDNFDWTEDYQSPSAGGGGNDNPQDKDKDKDKDEDEDKCENGKLEAQNNAAECALEVAGHAADAHIAHCLDRNDETVGGEFSFGNQKVNISFNLASSNNDYTKCENQLEWNTRRELSKCDVAEAAEVLRACKKP
jgi:hypothetical protein